MDIQVLDFDGVIAEMGKRYPGTFVVLPPLAPTGRCGICGEFVTDPATAPRGVHVVPPTDDIGAEILLCPQHKDGAS